MVGLQTMIQLTPLILLYVLQVTTKHDVEDAKANVDYGVYSPSNKLLQNGNGVTDGEVELHAAAESQGPWKICFRVSGGKLLRPSVIVDISYFSITFEDYDGDTFEWEYDVADGDGKSEHEVDKDELASHQQVSDIVQGLEKLDHYLRNVTNEQRFLYARTVRHLKTAQSTLSRTYSYYSFVYLVIILASMSQILVIRLMFKKVCCESSLSLLVFDMAPFSW